MRRKQIAAGTMLLALVAAALVLPGIQWAGGPVERLTNGGFEEGFYATPLGLVGNGWQWFVSGGGAKYGFYQDTWAPVVLEGTGSQLLEINTVGESGQGAPHYSGIYQTVSVVPGTNYELTLHGMLRALEDDSDRENYSYRVQYGIDYQGGTSWELVSDWVEVPWDRVHPRLSPGVMESHVATIAASGPQLTLFVRAWYKWGTANRELDANLDALSLKGALPAGGGSGSGKTYTVVTGSGSSAVVLPPEEESGVAAPVVELLPPSYPVATWAYQVQVTSKSPAGVARLELYDGRALLGRVSYAVGPLQLENGFDWVPRGAGRHLLTAVAYDSVGGKTEQEAEVTVGGLGQFLSNGSFEQGFVPSAVGMVGKSWNAFSTAGGAAYGFYDETWTPVVHDGGHSQLIEINTIGSGGAGADRYAGIYQTVGGLTKGADYRLSVHGMLRVRADDLDREGYNYRLQWGLAPDGSADWKAVANWIDIPWDTIHLRLDPGPMEEYTAAFEAPASRVTVFIRASKKWATVQRELDVNLDAISLEGYTK
jgi:hypothetical protein